MAANVSWESDIMYNEVLSKGGEMMPVEGYPNLIANSERTPEELRAQTSRAGKASGEARRRRKTFAEGLKELLSMPEDDPEVRALLQKLGLEGTMQDAMNVAQIRQAKKGDSDAFRLVRDTVGEKPREELEIGGLADRPIQTIDLTKLSDDDLRRLADARTED